MSKPRDLTRWNRAGLSRLRYVDGNAAEYLEILRQQLAEKFVEPGKETEHRWLQPAQQVPAVELPGDDETLHHRQQRLNLRQQRITEMYNQQRRDVAWEMSRVFARSCHILLEHIDAYANEAYLGTATQWEHVRRLVGMLDYRPAPPASATTRLVITGKEDLQGVLPKGFQVKYLPPLGGKKIVFETLEDLLVDPALNELRPNGWNRSEAPAIPPQKREKNTGGEKQLFSSLAEQPIKALQGVGDKWSRVLTDAGYSKVRDLLHLSRLEAAALPIPAVRLREFKARATAISGFSLESGWAEISQWKLTEIAKLPTTKLSEITLKPEEDVEGLQLRIELIGSYLDHQVYEQAKLLDLLSTESGEKSVSPETESLETPWLAPKKPKVVAGQVAMIVNDRQKRVEAASVARVEEESRVIHLLPSSLQRDWLSWPQADAQLQVAPRWQQKCWLNGVNVIRTAAPHGLTAESYICWQEEQKGKSWRFAKIIEADSRNLRLQPGGSLPEEKTELFEARPLEGPNLPAEIEDVGLLEEELPADALKDITAESLEVPDSPDFPEIVSTQEDDGGIVFSLGKLPKVGSFLLPSPFLPVDLVKAAVKLLLEIGAMVIPSTGEPVFKFVEPLALAESLFDLVEDSESVKWANQDNPEDVKEQIMDAINLPEGEEPVFFKVIKEVITKKGPFLVVPKDPPVKAVVVRSDPAYVFDGEPDKIIPGDRIVARFTEGLKATTISAIKVDGEADYFSLHFADVVGNEGELVEVYGDFRGLLDAEGNDINETILDSQEIELEQVPESLKVGRSVLLSCGGKSTVAAKIVQIEGNVVTTDARDFVCSKGDLRIHGNVVLAGHGESKPVKILGSGRADRSNQEITLEVDQVSFIPDSGMIAGVAAAIEVFVDGRSWQQVSSLKDSEPGDHHYGIRMTEEGYVKILFGDGRHGRRLPTGKNNIRVSYRVGSGRSGNVVAGGLEKPVNPHPLVAAIHQPLRAAGGGDMEDVDSLRENAPATVLSLGRAVSLTDFSHLARSQSGIWQARAQHQLLAGGRREGIKVVVVPAEGVFSNDLQRAMTSFLQKHALPGVEVSVASFSAAPFSLSALLRIDVTAYVADDVEKEVRGALLEHFSLEQRKLGEHLYLSEVYGVVENIQGVENSLCTLLDDPAVQLIRAESEATVIFLAPEEGSNLVISSEEYTP